MRRKITATLASIALLAAMTACGTSNTSTSDADVSFYNPTGFTKTFKAALQPLTDQAGAPHVNFTEAGADYNALNARIIREAATGHLPDVAIVATNHVRNLVDLGIAQPLDDAIANGSMSTKDVVPSILKLGQYSGKQYGMALGVSTRILGVNADMFKAAGLDPTHLPTTWNELREDAMKLADPAKHKYGLTMDWSGNSNLEFQQQLTSAGGALLNPDGTTPAFNSPQGESVLNYWGGLVKDGALPLLARPTGVSAELQAFLNGDAAMTIQSTGSLSDLNTNTKFHFVAGPVPIADGGTRTAPATGIAVVMLTKDPHRQAAAIKVIQQLITPAAGLTLAPGYLPASSSALNDPQIQKYASERETVRIALQAVPYLSQWQTYPGGHDVEVNDAIETNVLAALNGTKTPGQALTESQDAVKKILGTK